MMSLAIQSQLGNCVGSFLVKERDEKRKKRKKRERRGKETTKYLEGWP
jgi:hypothetical protein